jgi:serine/threonine protein phosphatase 1
MLNRNHLDNFLLTAIANTAYLREIGHMRKLRQLFPWHSKSPERKKPSVPAGVRIYAIGDVHGRVDLLDSLLRLIDQHLKASPIERPVQVFLGDYIDRGPASRAVLERLIERNRTHELICLKGNHDILVERFLKDPAFLEDWRDWGGLPTLISYGLIPPSRIEPAEYENLASALRQTMPKEHRDFLRQLRTSFVCGDYCFVHAGVRPGVPLAKQKEEDLLWIRDEFLNASNDFGKIIVHGHTPVEEVEIHPNRINIDTGAYASGNLTCLMIEGDKRFLADHSKSFRAIS